MSDPNPYVYLVDYDVIFSTETDDPDSPEVALLAFDPRDIVPDILSEIPPLQSAELQDGRLLLHVQAMDPETDEPELILCFPQLPDHIRDGLSLHSQIWVCMSEDSVIVREELLDLAHSAE